MMIKKLNKIIAGWRIPLVVSVINGGVLAPMACYGWLFSSIQAAVDANAVEAGWIGAVQFAFNLLSGPIAVLVERYLGYRLTTILGSTLSALSILLTSYMSSYIGILMFYAVGYGLSSCLTMHATVCVLFKCVDKSDRSKMTSIVFSVLSLSSMFLSVIYERLIPMAGWQFTLRFASAYVFLFGVPISFFLVLEEGGQVKVRTVSMQIDVTSSMGIRQPSADAAERGEIASISKEVEKAELAREERISRVDNQKGWLELLGCWKAWMILVALTFPSMAWSTYWFNIVSYFESLGLSEQTILLNVTVITVFEVLGRLVFAFFGNKLPLREVNLFIVLNIVLVLVTSVLSSLPPQSILLACCVVIGITRGWSGILPYGAASDLLRGYSVDQGVTLTMIALGIGYTLGSLPTGIIYDATGSYAFAFFVNALFFLIGATIFVLLQVQRRCAKVKRIRIVQQPSGTNCEPCINYAYEKG